MLNRCSHWIYSLAFLMLTTATAVQAESIDPEKCFDTENAILPDLGPIKPIVQSNFENDYETMWLLSELSIEPHPLVKIRSAKFALPLCPLITSIFP